MEDVRIVNICSTLTKALASTGNSVGQFAGYDILSAPPTGVMNAAALDTIQGDGIWDASIPSYPCPRRILLVPYGEGAVGSSFSFRVYGWRKLPNQLNQGAGIVWLPLFLAEFACTLCNRGGFPGAVLLDSEHVCDTISLTQGGLGEAGEINSTGPGTDLLAFALLDIRGCEKIQFDFQQLDNIGMNCFWGRI